VIFFSLVEVVITAGLGRKGKAELARTVDVVSRILFSLAFAVEGVVTLML